MTYLCFRAGSFGTKPSRIFLAEIVSIFLRLMSEISRQFNLSLFSQVIARLYLWAINGSGEYIILNDRAITSLSASDFIFNTSINSVNAFGTMSDDVLFGAGGKDVFSGSGGDDALVGGLGDDTIMGGSGNDVLIGGGGNDVFVYTNKYLGTNFFDTNDFSNTFGADRILDFSPGDRIDVSALNISEFASIQPFITQSGNNSVLNLRYGGRASR